MKRRSFLQGVAACFAAILSPLKLKATSLVRTTGYLRVVDYTWAKHFQEDDLNPKTRYGSFNKFINTPYNQRMTVVPEDSKYIVTSSSWLTSQGEIERNILRDRQEVPLTLGPDKRQRWVDAAGYEHDHHLRNQIIEAIREHSPNASPFGGGALTGA